MAIDKTPLVDSLPRDARIWVGWSHLLEVRNDLSDREIAQQALDIDLASKELRAILSAIWSITPQVLQVEVSELAISDQERDSIMQALRDVAEPGRQFILLRRFLEVVDAGIQVGRFRMRIPYVPAPPPPQAPSPFRHERFESYVQFLPLLKAFEQSLSADSSLSNDGQWGQVLFSAMAYGALLKAKWLMAIPAALDGGDPQLRWLYLRPAKPESKDVAAPEPRRWFPDPLTRLLLLELRKQERFLVDFTVRPDYHWVIKLIRVYAKERDFLQRCPKGLRAITQPLTTRLYLHVPPWLVSYATEQRPSSSLPEWSWQRLVNPPSAISSELTPREKIQAARVASSLNDEEDGENDVHDEAADETTWPEQMRSLAVEIRKGNEGLRDRIDRWLKVQTNELLPSVQRFAEWLFDDVTKSKSGRHLRKSSTVYQMLNGGGSRLVGQFGKIDPLAVHEESTFVEWYQNALEDAPSVGTRRKVARTLKSFHQYLVDRSAREAKAGEASVPPVTESGLFVVTGRSNGTVDANVIGLDTFFRAIVWLRKAGGERLGHAMAEQLSLIAVLGFFAGLRRSEALGLLIGDVLGANDLHLIVRPNGLRDLKTRAGHRHLPLMDMLPLVEQQRLKAWVEKRQVKAGLSDPLFPEFVGPYGVRNTDPRLELITEALQRAADDETLRFHHLRHSFATWMLFKLFVGEAGGPKTLPDWFLPTEHDRRRWVAAVTERNQLLGESPVSRRALYQVSHLMGHSGADITLSSYIHLSDFMLGQLVPRLIPEMSLDRVAALVKMNPKYLATLATLPEVAVMDGVTQTARLLMTIAARAGKIGHQEESQPLPAINFSSPPAKKKPVQAYELLDHHVQALRELIASPDQIQLIADKYQINAAVLTNTLLRIEKLTPGIGDESGLPDVVREQNRRVIPHFPEGEMQVTIARHMVSALVDYLRASAEKHVAPSAKLKPVKMLVEGFNDHWVPGTFLTTRFDSLPDAKRWLWFVGLLKFSSGVTVEHVPGRGEGFPSAARQIDYWSKGLGIEICPNGTGTTSSVTRGEVLVSISLKRVPKSIVPYRKDSGVTAVRSVLVFLNLLGLNPFCHI